MNDKEIEILQRYIDENNRLKQLTSSLMLVSSVGKLQSENVALRGAISVAIQTLAPGKERTALQLALNPNTVTPPQELVIK